MNQNADALHRAQTHVEEVSRQLEKGIHCSPTTALARHRELDEAVEELAKSPDPGIQPTLKLGKRLKLRLKDYALRAR